MHFKSKDELIAIIISNYVNKVDDSYKEYIEKLPADMPICDVLLSFVGKIADVMTNTIGYKNVKVLYRTRLENDNKTHIVTDYNRELYVIFKDIVIRGMEQNAFHSDLSAEEIARHFVTAYRGLVLEWCFRYPDFDLKEQALHHFKILLTGISSPSHLSN